MHGRGSGGGAVTARAGSDRFLVVGHRGAAAVAPENTAPSFHAALAAGVDAIEFDVQRTADDRAVAHHDLTTKRVCGRRGGRVRSLTLDELRNLHVRRGFAGAVGGAVRQISLDEALALARPEVEVFVELKGEPADAEVLAVQVVGALARTGGFQRARVLSAVPELLAAVALRAPAVAVHLVYQARSPLDLDATLERLGASGVVPNHRHVNRAFVRGRHRRGNSVVPYTINTRAGVDRMTAAGADGVVTDCPARVAGWIGRGKARKPLADAAVLAIDVGSTMVDVGVVDQGGRLVRLESVPCPTVSGARGEIGVDAALLEREIRRLAGKLLRTAPGVNRLAIAAQRSTFVLWDRETGEPCGDAPSWRCDRARALVAARKGAAEDVRRRTGLRLAGGYAAGKIAWKLRQTRDRDLLCAPLSGYLLWKWSRGVLLRTDPTLAARMLLMNLESRDWDPKLLALWDIPSAILPDIGSSHGSLGEVRLGGRLLEVRCEIGDQQAALHGLAGAGAAPVHLNLGTGAFLLADTGRRARRASRLLTSVARHGRGGTRYVLEGAIRGVASTVDQFAGEHALDRLGLAELVARGEGVAGAELDSGAWVLPAREGLASPFWDPRRRFVVRGRRDPARVAHALYAAFGFLVSENLEAMRRHIGSVDTIEVAGGLTRDPHLLQVLADATSARLRVSAVRDATLVGAARLALGLGKTARPDPVAVFEPRCSAAAARRSRRAWRRRLNLG